ncbi:MAG: phosphatidate cytidylyltransferase [Nitriliruptor sp.]|nr:MAG: phosphatidate cytidylyltransferase [Nitriliruptor sp.]
MAGDAQAPDAGESSSRAVVGGRNLPVAIAVGVVLAGLFLAALFWHPIAFTAVVAVVIIMAFVESHRVLAPVGFPLQVSVLLLTALTITFGTYLLGHLGQLAGVLVLLVGAVLWQLIEGEGRRAVQTMSTTVFFGLWVGFLGSFAILLVQRPGVGPLAVLAVIGAAILSDIGGYAFGVTLGKHKLAPRVSPNKTWEGLLGGLVVAIAAGAIVLPLLDERFTPLIGGMIAGLAAVASVIGDLAESMVKRDLGVKDLGDVLPGHGGVLDRVDGILFALPVGYVAAVLVL